MNTRQVRRILKDNDFIHTSATSEELQVAEYLKAECEKLGAEAKLEAFPVLMAQIEEAVLYADGKEIPCKGYKNSMDADLEAEFCYLPNTDPVSLKKVKGKIVLLDTGIGYYTFRDLLANGAAGFITYDGSCYYPDRDIDQKELRTYVSMGKRLPGVNINAKDARALVKSSPKKVRICLKQREYVAESHNVVAQIPGSSDEWIVLSAHYDTTSLSRGQYDNLTGCIGVLGILEAMKKNAPHRYGIRAVFCGSEERGLLGSKAYVRDHKDELGKIALNINLDMIGTIMGKFIACVSAEEALVSYIRYFAAEKGWGIQAKNGVYSSDSTPFADNGVPSLSFARLAPPSQAIIHNRYDRADVLSEEQMLADIDFMAAFTKRMADACVCPVGRELPESVKHDLDVYTNRVRKEN